MTPPGPKPTSPLLLTVSMVAWLLALALLTSRTYFLMPYGTASLLTDALEPFGASLPALVAGLMLVGTWVWLRQTSSSAGMTAWLYLLLASLPTALWLLRLSGIAPAPRMFIEAIWFSAWTGCSFGALLVDRSSKDSFSGTNGSPLSSQRTVAILILCIAGCGSWWFYQAWWHHHSFLMGFNDYGHFLQRISNTVRGNGLLLETPVLPAFWDHFNPGLLCLAPLWAAWPDVQQAFLWQVIALAGSGYLIYRIALSLNIAPTPASLFGIAWLVQPAVGQMNLAYSYGWHPITQAIPLLLVSIWSLLNRRWWLAAVCTAVALSMEEGVFVIVALTAGCCAALQWLDQRGWFGDKLTLPDSARASLITALSWRVWFAIAVLSAVGFVAVYKLSGLAEFQTGRFVALGSNTTEVILSPILRPSAFWGSLLRWDRWYYVLLLTLPGGLPAMLRGWPYLLPTLLPLGVLMVWDHAPAHCIAFQYASVLLPLMWMGVLTGASADERTGRPAEMTHAVTALATGLSLSIFIGQLPLSQPTLVDVDGRTYGPDQLSRRRLDEEDGQWLTQQIKVIRSEDCKCLATGRIAAHLVGMPDIETVGQYSERRAALSQLADRRDHPLRHYDCIILDRQEGFQQSREQTDAVESEARAEGFVDEVEKYGIVVLRRGK